MLLIESTIKNIIISIRFFYKNNFMEVDIVSKVELTTLIPCYRENKPIYVADDNNNGEPDITDRVLVARTDDGWKAAENLPSSITRDNMEQVGFWNRPYDAETLDVDKEGGQIDTYEGVMSRDGRWELGGEIVALKANDTGRNYGALHVQTRQLKGGQVDKDTRGKFQEQRLDDSNWRVKNVDDRQLDFRADEATLKQEEDVRVDVNSGRTTQYVTGDNCFVVPTTVHENHHSKTLGYGMDINNNGRVGFRGDTQDQFLVKLDKDGERSTY
jgi:hypothetical protein